MLVSDQFVDFRKNLKFVFFQPKPEKVPEEVKERVEEKVEEKEKEEEVVEVSSSNIAPIPFNFSRFHAFRLVSFVSFLKLGSRKIRDRASLSGGRRARLGG